MAILNNASVSTTTIENTSPARASFLASRPDLNTVYSEWRTPGSLYAYYNAFDGAAELYIVDPSGYKFLGFL